MVVASSLFYNVNLDSQQALRFISRELMHCFIKHQWGWRQQLLDNAWEGAFGVSWALPHHSCSGTAITGQGGTSGSSMQGWRQLSQADMMINACAGHDGFTLNYTCVNNWRCSPKDLILLESNFGRFALMSVGARSSRVLPVLISVSKPLESLL